MDFHYFGKKLSGGANSSMGFTYQDNCAIISYFENLKHGTAIKSMSVETINDFVLHREKDTVAVQVKKSRLSIKDVKNILLESYSDKNNRIMIIASHFHIDLENLIKKKKQYLDMINSDFDKAIKEMVISEFNKELSKQGLVDIKEVFLQCEFNCYQEDNVEAILLASIYTWTEMRKIHIDIRQFINDIKVKIQSLRSERGKFSNYDLDLLLQKHSIESAANKIINEIYHNKIIKSSKILAILGDTKDSILKPLEEKLKEADEYIRVNNYTKAVKIYSSLAILYPKIDILLQCALLNELCNDYEKTINYANEILKLDSNHFEANFIKATSLGSLKLYSEAIEQFKTILSYKETPLLYYNLAYTLQCTNDESEALKYYKLCLKMDDNFSSAHLNISFCYFNKREIEKSLYHLNKAIQLDSSQYKAYGRKGELYRFLGLYDDAILYFEECLKLDKSNYEALLGIALCFAEQGCLSEASIHFKHFFRYHYDKFFKPDDEIGKKVMLIDIGNDRTLIGIIELLEEHRLNIQLEDTCIPISLSRSNDFMILGTLPLIGNSTPVVYPIVGKIYEKNDDFISVIKKIKNSVNLFQFFESPLFINFEDNICVNLLERKNYVLMEIIFDDTFCISGMTNTKTGGLEAFMNCYSKRKEYRFHLECIETKEVFEIPLENVNVDLINKDN